jgi:TatD DNase family protein
MLVDSHCHLNYKGMVEDQQAVLARRAQPGDARFSTFPPRSEWGDVVGTAEREPDVWASIGIHPHEAEQHADLGEGALLEAAAHPRVIAIGESGLDYLLRQVRPRGAARPVPHAHRRVAAKPAAADRSYARCRGRHRGDPGEEMDRGLPALIHCFTASAGFGPQGARARADDLAVGHHHLQECP